MTVSDLMQTSVATLREGDTLDIANDIMALGLIRHLPVTDSTNRAIGMITQSDLYRAAVSSTLGFDRTKEQEWLSTVRVGDVMTRQLITVNAEAELAEAVEKMAEVKIGCLPVVNEDGVLIGLVTETDFLRCLHDLLKTKAPRDS